MNTRDFAGKVITDSAFEALSPRNVFHRQLQPLDLAADTNENSHVLFRKEFELCKKPSKAVLYITADDYYKAYINGRFVCQGPAPAYSDKYGYNVVDVTDFICDGQNLIAVHTYYQGLINRVWVSGDNRHGLLFDLECDGRVEICSDTSVKTHRHTAYTPNGYVGYKTQIMENYDSRASEVGFEKCDFDDSAWENSRIKQNLDYTFVQQTTKMLELEEIKPVNVEKRGNVLFVDFGKNYVGYLNANAKGEEGQVVNIRSGQELNEDGSVRNNMRCNCNYSENWTLSGKNDALNQFDFKPLRYVEFESNTDVEIFDISFTSRHYPFELSAKLREEYANDKDLQKIWELCVNSQKYGIQEVIQDCMDREKGFYVGDGCYTALTHFLLSGDDSICRKLIDDGFHSSFVTEGLLTCLDCSFCQEIAEYPLMLISLVYWHYALTGDVEYLKQNYFKLIKILDSYRESYEKDGILTDLDKWCVVEWPANFRDGYAVDITEGKVCSEAHVSINAYYIHALNTANKISEIVGEPKYRDVKPVLSAFDGMFYDKAQHKYVDGQFHDHVSYIGNIFPFAFGLCEDKEFYTGMLCQIEEKGVHSASLFTTFLILCGLVRLGKYDMIKAQLKDSEAWLRMIREGATTTFEGWGKDSKWNTSLFHLTFSYAAVFMTDRDVSKLFL